MIHRKFFMTMLSVLFLFSGHLMGPQTLGAGPPPLPLGGACQYQTYNGRAVITGIMLAGIGSDSYQGGRHKFRIKFIFLPDSGSAVSRWIGAGREYDVTYQGQTDLSQEFLETRNLQVGRSYRGAVRIIRKGTCVPVIFQIPGLGME